MTRSKLQNAADDMATVLNDMAYKQCEARNPFAVYELIKAAMAVQRIGMNIERRFGKEA